MRALVLLLLLSVPGWAQSASRPVRARINAGQIVLTTTGANLAFPAITLNGTQQVASATSGPTFTIIDARGSGAGWNLTVSSTDFTTGLRNISNTGFGVSANGGTVTVVHGQAIGAGGPSETLTVGTLSAAVKVLRSQANFGMGNYLYTPLPSQYTLQIPADTYAGNYTAVMTFTLASGP